ncbi:rubrerythrin family protein [Natrialba sp. PRR66]|uniref:rubrerythrin family protein n=1 Tax=Natrialba sp. PRR66 TaxID=3098146 RepID=UPI002B1D3C2A|nr:rubrerythrin family protein [Natrialba sp. PRR66]
MADDSDTVADFDAFLDTVRETAQTELSRLGSSKSLYAETGGDIDTEPVLEATADAEYAAWQTFSAWADDESHDGAREAFEATAAEEEGHFETVRDELGDDEYEPDAIPALHDHLRGIDATVERVGALAGRILASKRSKEQVVGYFVGDADPQTAAVFREFGDDLDAQLERTGEVFAAVCQSEADQERAMDAATGAIEAAYAEYVENMEAMGANPKPVC